MLITVETTIAAPIESVWNAWTTPDDIVQWNAASDDWHTTSASVDLRVGGSFSSRMEAKDGSAGFDFEGTYTRIVPMECIEAEFGGRDLIVEFLADNGLVRVRETFDAEEIHSIEQQREGWQAILNRFAAHVEERQLAGLPPAVAGFFRAHNSGHTNNFLEFFTSDAVVRDESQEYRDAAITAWMDNAIAKYAPKAVIQSVDPVGDAVAVTALVGGKFPGSPAEIRYQFTLRGNLIASLNIE